jgi:hypothetical protein
MTYTGVQVTQLITFGFDFNLSPNVKKLNI